METNFISTVWIGKGRSRSKRRLSQRQTLTKTGTCLNFYSWLMGYVMQSLPPLSAKQKMGTFLELEYEYVVRTEHPFCGRRYLYTAVHTVLGAPILTPSLQMRKEGNCLAREQ